MSKQIVKEAETIVIELRRTYYCKGDHVGQVVWRRKTLGEYCSNKKLQRECKKFCCACCPKRDRED